MKDGKLKSLEEMRIIIEEVKSAGKKVVLANGCFDLLHGGHVSYLEAAKEVGDVLVVAVNSDNSVHRLKDARLPIMPEDERVELLSEMECVDYVVLFDDETCDPVLQRLKPDYHAKGTDYTRETVPERDTARKMGIETVIVGNAKENATRNIIAMIIERYGSG